jgi:hypothetical protein
MWSIILQKRFDLDTNTLQRRYKMELPMDIPERWGMLPPPKRRPG